MIERRSAAKPNAARCRFVKRSMPEVTNKSGNAANVSRVEAVANGQSTPRRSRRGAPHKNGYCDAKGSENEIDPFKRPLRLRGHFRRIHDVR